MEKHCAKCKTIFDLMPKPYNGHSYMCRRCNTERCKKYRKTPNGKKKTHDAIRAYQKRDHNKVKARQAVLQLERPDRCSDCDKIGPVDGHHENYAKPLEVVWLCRQCHATKHR